MKTEINNRKKTILKYRIKEILLAIVSAIMLVLSFKWIEACIMIGTNTIFSWQLIMLIALVAIVFIVSFAGCIYTFKLACDIAELKCSILKIKQLQKYK